MFPYTDPSGSGLLAELGALEAYRRTLNALYVSLSRLPDSAFTLLDAFEGVGAQPVQPVTWQAFPKTAGQSFGEIDANRFDFQDEYVEWRVERDTDGMVTRVIFTTEFPEYFEALAAQGEAAVVGGVQDVIPGANPTTAELFGPSFDPAQATDEARAAQFRFHARRNPWNNGEKGILFLSQRFNTLGALFNLAGHCAVFREDLPANAVCAAVGGFCGPQRNSDPRVCQAVQNLARSENGLSLADPVGVEILRLTGIWKRGGQQIDPNDTEAHGDVWQVSREGRRAVLNVVPGLSMGDDLITTGSQVSTVLEVGVRVIAAPEGDLPPWARTGQESSRRITE